MAKNRAAQIEKVHKVLKKHFQPIETPERTVLEHLVYACCLENSPYDKADAAYRRICESSFDWNEVRVTAVSELAEAMAGYVQPKRSANNLRKSLQGLFETYYSFDLEFLRKQNLGKTTKDLERHEGITPFTIGYLMQHALGGHAIPLDRGALDVMFIADVIDEKERARNAVPGLERAISKKQGQEFSSLLHQLAAMFIASPFSAKPREILLEMNPDGKERMPKRKSRKKKVAEKQTKPTPKPATADKPKTKKAAAKKKAAPVKKAKKTPPVKAKKTPPAKAKKTPVKAKKAPVKAKKATTKAKATKPAKKKAKKTTQKPPSRTKKASKKKSPTKALAKRKPR